MAIKIAESVNVELDDGVATGTLPLWLVGLSDGSSDTVTGDPAGSEGMAHSTFHHPFFDITQAAFVDASKLRVADQLQITAEPTADLPKSGASRSGTGPPAPARAPSPP